MISQEYEEELINLHDAAKDLQRHFLPSVNYGASAISADGVAALNEFNITLSNLRAMKDGDDDDETK